MASSPHLERGDTHAFLDDFEAELGDGGADQPRGTGEVIRTLLHSGADLHSDPISPNMFIAKIDDTGIVQSLLDRKADVTTAKESMHTARTKDKKLVQLLIQKKATVQIPAKASDQIIVRTDKPELVKLLIERKADVTAPKEDAVHSVVRTTDKNIVKYMLESKIEVLCDPKSTQQFYARLPHYDDALVQTLVKLGAEVVPSKVDQNLLHVAVKGGGDANIVNLLLESQVESKGDAALGTDLDYRKGRQGILTVKVHKGQKLPNMDIVGKQDPYVILKTAGSKAEKTKVHKKGGSDPEWQETFNFDLFGTEETLDLEVWDEDVFVDDSIGVVKIPLMALLDNEKIGREAWHKIYKKDSKGQERGEILLTASFKPWFPGTLSITVHSGENLTNHELIGNQSPFCEVYLNGSHKQSTRVHDRGGVNPEWNDTFNYHCVGRETVTFKVWDKETVLANDFIGGRHLPVSKLQTNAGTGIHHYAIFEGATNFEKKLAGSLSVTTTWTPDAVVEKVSS